MFRPYFKPIPTCAYLRIAQDIEMEDILLEMLGKVNETQESEVRNWKCTSLSVVLRILEDSEVNQCQL